MAIFDSMNWLFIQWVFTKKNYWLPLLGEKNIENKDLEWKKLEEGINIFFAFDTDLLKENALQELVSTSFLDYRINQTKSSDFMTKHRNYSFQFKTRRLILLSK